MTTAELLELLQSRYDALRRELSDVAPHAFTDQRHLNAGTPENAYWHLGYLSALSDVLRLLKPTPNPKRE